MTDVVDLLDRPVYGFGQVDHLLSLTPGTARRWIDGYKRGSRIYEPVVRLASTGSEFVTWGEFVETRLLLEYRDSGVRMIHMRPVVERLRHELDMPYPLASAKTWLTAEGRELVWRVQDEVDLDRQLAMVVRTGQGLLDWSPEAQQFRRSADWAGHGTMPDSACSAPLPTSSRFRSTHCAVSGSQ